MDETSQLGKLKAEQLEFLVNKGTTQAYLFCKLSITLSLDHIYNMAPNFGEKEIA